MYNWRFCKEFLQEITTFLCFTVRLYMSSYVLSSPGESIVDFYILVLRRIWELTTKSTSLRTRFDSQVETVI